MTQGRVAAQHALQKLKIVRILHRYFLWIFRNTGVAAKRIYVDPLGLQSHQGIGCE